MEVRRSRLLLNLFDDWLFKEMEGWIGRRVLEIGCGLGNHFQHLLNRDLLCGFDLSAEAVSVVRQQFAGHANLEASVMDITDTAVLRLRERQFDTALSVNVFEHIEDDDLAMKHTCELLQPGGHFILVVPAHHWLYGPMDSSIGHYRRYTKSSARDKLERCGFQVVLQKYVNMLGALGWLVNGRVLRRQVPPRGQLRVLNRLVPMLRRLENWFPAPFGVSVLSVCRKAGAASAIPAPAVAAGAR